LIYFKYDKNEPVIRIPGVDTEEGMAVFDDELDIYITVLRSYIDCVPELLGKLNAENLRACAISVHGIKSCNANIGAKALRATAHEMEVAATGGDADRFTALLEPFVNETNKLVADITACLSEYDATL
jgi:HPt (histidine-containing phosphotransfer) domain-containing protein